MVANMPKVSFWPDGSTIPENYGSLWYVQVSVYVH
jgi:hypothetical protein